MKKITRTITSATYELTLINKCNCNIYTQELTIMDVEDETNLNKFIEKYVNENCTNCLLVKFTQQKKVCRKYAMDIDKFVENAEIVE